MPSLIPKLLSCRGKEERLKRQDSKDDIRHSSKIARKDPKEESSKSSSLVASPTSASKDETSKSGIRIFRRNSREDAVGKDSSANSIKEPVKGKQQEKQERTDSVGGAARSRTAGESSGATRCEDDDDEADKPLSCESVDRSVTSVEREVDDVTLDSSRRDEEKKVDAGNRQETRGMLDVIVAENRMRDERMLEQRTMVVGGEEEEDEEEEEVTDAKYSLVSASREPIESVAENDTGQDNDEKETSDVSERLVDVSSDGDIGTSSERKSPPEINYGKRSDDFQVVSERNVAYRRGRALAIAAHRVRVRRCYRHRLRASSVRFVTLDFTFDMQCTAERKIIINYPIKDSYAARWACKERDESRDLS